MKRAYSAVLRPVVLWVVLLGSMAGVAGASAAVLAAGVPESPQACFGHCLVGTDCPNPLFCNCNSNSTCYDSQ